MFVTSKPNLTRPASILYCTGFAFLFFTGCNTEDRSSSPPVVPQTSEAVSAHADDARLRVGGSTTMMPILNQIAMDFTARYGTWDRAKTGLPHEPIIIHVTGGGSSAGIKMTAAQTVAIGLCSRDLEEKDRLALGVHASFLVGKDCVAIAAAKSNPLVGVKKGLTKAELATFFGGGYKTFRDIDSSLPNDECILYARTPGSGSSEIIKDHIMNGRPISPAAVVFSSQTELVENLKEQPRAVAFMSYAQVKNSKMLIAFEVDGVEPNNRNVTSGRYKLSRPLLMIVKGTPSAKTSCFIEYVLHEGQAVVASHGCLPARVAD